MTTSTLTESPPRATGMVRLLRAIHGRAYPRLIGVGRDKTWTFYEILLPLLGTFAFVYVYKALHAPDRFIGYVIMGGATTAVWLNVMFMMASQLWWEKKDGNLELHMIAPCGLLPILLGMSVGGIFMATVRAVSVVILGSLAFHVSYAPTQIPAFVLVFVVAIVGLYALGVALSSVFLVWGREAWHTTQIFMEPVYLVSGFYFPVRVLGFATGLVASVIPLTLALDAIRQLLYPHTHPKLLGVWTEIGILAALAVALIFLARFSLQRMEVRARREGSLGQGY
ncbi:MAG: ABC transporter permease [Actinobacteria bacterium]|nr:MAG: ABC transporter permease [Actinomycetota bacterium]